MLPITSIISRDVKTCLSKTTVLQAALVMAENNIGSIVIVEGKKPVGIFTERDLLIRVVANKLEPEKTPIVDVMTKDITVMDAREGCSAVFLKMKEKKIRHLPVLEKGELVGIISLKDVISLMNEMLLKQTYPPDSSGLY